MFNLADYLRKLPIKIMTKSHGEVKIYSSFDGIKYSYYCDTEKYKYIFEYKENKTFMNKQVGFLYIYYKNKVIGKEYYIFKNSLFDFRNSLKDIFNNAIINESNYNLTNIEFDLILNFLNKRNFLNYIPANDKYVEVDYLNTENLTCLRIFKTEERADISKFLIICESIFGTQFCVYLILFENELYIEKVNFDSLKNKWVDFLKDTDNLPYTGYDLNTHYDVDPIFDRYLNIKDLYQNYRGIELINTFREELGLKFNYYHPLKDMHEIVKKIIKKNEKGLIKDSKNYYTFHYSDSFINTDSNQNFVYPTKEFCYSAFNLDMKKSILFIKVNYSEDISHRLITPFTFDIIWSLDQSSQTTEIVVKYFNNDDLVSQHKINVDYKTVNEKLDFNYYYTKIEEFLIKEIVKKYPSEHVISKLELPLNQTTLSDDEYYLYKMIEI